MDTESSRKKEDSSRKKSVARKRTGEKLDDESVKKQKIEDDAKKEELKACEEDEIWKAQQDYTLIRWRLCDSCRVHVLLMDTGVTIHMLIEKKYLLT
ncbi:hypothetical protein Tco_0491015 [Tanacetum coccineum]